jgi:hypothetical protein
MTELEKAILQTVAYFNVFNYPLTPWEIWKWLFWSTSNPVPRFIEVLEAVDHSPLLKQKLERTSGFVYVKGRPELVSLRQERYRLALIKMKKVKRFVKALRVFPFIQYIGVCNSLGLANARTESDNDLFIIAEPNHIWAVRFLTTAFARLRGLRPSVTNRADTFCLSFFITTDVLDLSHLRYAEDPYFNVWLASLVPIFDPNHISAQLWQNNPWINSQLPNAIGRQLATQREVGKTWVTGLLVIFFRWRWFEYLVKHIQLRILPASLRKLANTDSRVIINDQILKFHDNDRRQQYAQQYHENATLLGAPL